MVMAVLRVKGRPHQVSSMTQRFQMRPYTTTVMEIDDGARRVSTGVSNSDGLVGDNRNGANSFGDVATAGGSERVGNCGSRGRGVGGGFGGQLEIGIRGSNGKGLSGVERLVVSEW